MKRFAFTGPESTGKSTLAALLAAQHGGVFVPEYARAYLAPRNGNYTEEDLNPIAKGQLEAWENSPESPFLFCDTEMIVMKIWAEYKYKRCSEFIRSALSNQRFDHYFLCCPDIPWEADPLREHPFQREEFFELFLAELQALNAPFSLVKGTLEERIRRCNEVIESSGKRNIF